MRRHRALPAFPDVATVRVGFEQSHVDIGPTIPNPDVTGHVVHPSKFGRCTNDDTAADRDDFRNDGGVKLAFSMY